MPESASSAEAPSLPDPSTRSVREQAVHTALAYLMAESVRGRPQERRRIDQRSVFRLRDSLAYRAESVRWHPSLISLVARSATRRLREVHKDEIKEIQLMLQIGAEHFYVFDDLIFNALALFDYVGNMVGFSLYGEQRRKAKWTRIERYARNPEFERKEHPKARISSSSLGPCIREVHSSLVRALTDYRAALIHYEALVGPGQYSTRVGPDGPEYELHFQVPTVFTKLFTVPGYGAPNAELPLLVGANWLADRAELEAKRVLRVLELELRAEAGPQSSVELIA